MQPVRKVVTQKVLDIVSREVSDLCFRKKLSTVLRKTGKDDLMKFSLEQLCGSVLLKQIVIVYKFIYYIFLFNFPHV